MTKDLREGIAAFEKWRGSRNGKKTRIPDRLWKMAVELGQVHGFSRVSKLLKLNSATLKEKYRRASHGNAGGDTKSDKNGAVKIVRVAPINLADENPVQRPHPGRSSMIAEISSPSGLSLRIFSGMDPQTLKSLYTIIQEG